MAVGARTPKRKIDLIAIGRVGLPEELGSIISGPISARTGLKREQVEALLGGVFLVLAVVHFLRLVGDVIRAARGTA